MALHITAIIKPFKSSKRVKRPSLALGSGLTVSEVQGSAARAARPRCSAVGVYKMEFVSFRR